MIMKDKEFFNTKELKERWPCSINSIYNWVKKGYIPYIRTPGGRTLLFPVDGILEFEQKQRTCRKEVKRQLKKNRIPLTTLKKEWRVE